MATNPFAVKDVECKLCHKRTEEVISLFLDHVIELVEELTDLKVRLPLKSSGFVLPFFFILVE